MKFKKLHKNINFNSSLIKAKVMNALGSTPNKINDCLGFVSGNCCPHYDEEPQRKPSLQNFLNKEIGRAHV